MILRSSVFVRFASVVAGAVFVCGASCSDPLASRPPPRGDTVPPGSTSSTSSTGASVSSANASAAVGSGGGTTTPPPVPHGFLHTSGAQIVDENEQPVRITGMNWSGFETPTFSPHGLGVRSLGSILDQIRSLGYNAIRLPFATEIFDPAKTPLGIDYTKNPELSGLSGLALFDAVIAGARERGLKVILDRHRLDSSGQTELWYSAQIPESRVIAEWQTLAQRYKDDSTVIGVDLFNEPHGAARWGNGDPATDWRMAAERLGNAVLAVNPHLLILVEGVETANDRWYWWGGNLRAAGASPVSLSVPNQLVYSAHDYPVAVSTQPWFFDLSYPHNMPPIWDETWGYLHENGIAPVLVGEWGSRYESWMDQTWMNELAQYLKDNGISFTYWCLNPDSANTGGLLADDWTTVHAAKQAVLAPLLAPPLP